MNNKDKQTLASKDREVAYIIHPDVTGKKECRDISSVLTEIKGLARAIELDVVKTQVLKVSKIHAGSFFGKGQRENIGLEIEELQPDIVIVNHTLSPVQQRNLENAWKTKVIDRTGLILEIFGARAQTKEGRLQVELAALDYQRSRLVRSWTHLERQRGGAGFMGGPGERQIELDRRMISQRLKNLKKQLEKVRSTRELGRKSRERVPFPVIALVGYTNAGKSTLFNALTDAYVFAEDLPFATLDPTLRRITLPNKQEAILSDTVGFISNLPTHLIASFRATLEQISYADVIVHVIDISCTDYEAQKRDVIKILMDLGIEYENDERVIEVFNKIDAASAEDLPDFKRKSGFSQSMMLVSALTREGVDDFLDLCARIIGKKRRNVDFLIKITDGKAISWLHEHSEVLSRNDFDDRIEMHVMIEPVDLEKFLSKYGYSPQKHEGAKNYGGC